MIFGVYRNLSLNLLCDKLYFRDMDMDTFVAINGVEMVATLE